MWKKEVGEKPFKIQNPICVGQLFLGTKPAQDWSWHTQCHSSEEFFLSQQLPSANGFLVRGGTLCLLHSGIFVWLEPVWVLLYLHSLWESIWASALLCRGNVFSLTSSTNPDSYNLSAPLLRRSWALRKSCVQDISFRAEIVLMKAKSLAIDRVGL